MEWLTVILGLLGPLLAKCFGGVSSEDPRAYLKANYDPVTDAFDPGLVHDCMPQTYRAIRKAKRQAPRAERRSFPQYSRSEVYKMTEDKLRESMGATDKAVKACMAAAKQLPDDDDE